MLVYKQVGTVDLSSVNFHAILLRTEYLYTLKYDLRTFS